MKTILKSILFLFSTTTVFAQIPNSGFETWSAVGTYSVPDGWGTLNNTYTVQTATKGTPGSPGTSYLKLTSKTNGASVVNGMAVSGVLDSTTKQPISGFPFNQQPQKLTGKWQHMIYGSSQGSIQVTLTRWDSNTNSRVTVASGGVTLSGMAMSWASFSITLNYVDTSLPDSCIIFMKASGSNPTNNDYLWVDNLAFIGTVTGIVEKQASVNALSIYPNPVSNTINVRFNSKESQNTSIELYNVTGAKVYSEKLGEAAGTISHAIDASNFAKGVYILKVISGNAIENKKVIIE